MKKMFNALVCTVLLSVVSIQSSNAAVAAVAALFSPVVAGQIALTGLTTAGVGVVATTISAYTTPCRELDCLLPLFVGGYLGIILLDEEGNTTFSKISLNRANALEVSASDITIYNQEIEDVNMIFEEVKAEMNADITASEVKAVWADYSQYISAESFRVIKAISMQ